MSANVFQIIRKCHHRNISIYSSLDMCFPASDMQLIDHHIILLTVWGLMGIDSPLPLYFQELSKIEEGKKWIDFLRIIENELYRQSYLLWKKTRPIYFINKIQNSLLSTRQIKLYSSVSLIRELYQCLPYCLIELQENIPIWKKVSMTQNKTLGGNMILGNHILEVSSLIEIRIKTRDVTLASRLLNPSKQNHQLHLLIKSHLHGGQVYRCYIQLKLRQRHLLSLGDQMRLGDFVLIGVQPRRYYLPKMLSTHRIAGT